MKDRPSLRYKKKRNSYDLNFTLCNLWLLKLNEYRQIEEVTYQFLIYIYIYIYIYILENWSWSLKRYYHDYIYIYFLC